MKNEETLYVSIDDYAQSANTLFNFMKRKEYLINILRKKALIPRYCLENIEYLNIIKALRRSKNTPCY